MGLARGKSILSSKVLISVTDCFQTKKKKSKKTTKAEKGAKDNANSSQKSKEAKALSTTTPNGNSVRQRDLTPRVEEVEDD